MCASGADVACMLPKSPPPSPPPPSPPPPAPPRTRNFVAANWEKFDNLYCDSYAYQGNQHVAFSTLAAALAACAEDANCAGMAQWECDNPDNLFNFCGIGTHALRPTHPWTPADGARAWLALQAATAYETTTQRTSARTKSRLHDGSSWHPRRRWSRRPRLRRSTMSLRLRCSPKQDRGGG